MEGEEVNMMKIKKYLVLLFAFVLVACSLGLYACGNTSEEVSKDQKTPQIVLSESEFYLNRGEKKTLTYTLKNIEGTPEWFSFDTNVAEVSATGEVTAIGIGQTNIVCCIGDVSASCKVLISEKAIEHKELSLKLSASQITLNAESENNSVQLIATLTYEGAEVDGQITWQSTNSANVSVTASGSSVLVTALKNKVTEVITATATYDGITVSTTCAVFCQGYSEVVFGQSSMVIYPSETKELDFDLYVDSVLCNDRKGEVTYSVTDSKVVTVNEQGVVSAVKKGQADVILTFEDKQFTLPVTVGETVYVSTAQQFMNIDGVNGNVKFILQNNIDLSEHVKDVPTINHQALIKEFYGVLDGQGYTVSGWHRLCNKNDSLFNGLFGNIYNGAKIANVGFTATIETDISSALISNNCLGEIENCLFDFTLKTKDTAKNVLFNMNSGSVKNTIVKIAFANEQVCEIGIANSGIAEYKQLSVISPELSFGAKNGAFINNNFSESYYYQTQTAFIQKNGNVLSGGGIGDTAQFDGDNYNGQVFSVDGQDVLLINEQNQKPYKYVVLESAVYSQVVIGTETEIQMPSVDSAEKQCVIFNAYFDDVTTAVCVNGKFKPINTGEYYVIVAVKVDGVWSIAMSTVTVVRETPSINQTTVTLGNGNTEFQIEINGKEKTDFNYFCTDSRIANVSESGLIKAVKAGEVSITVAEKTGAYSYKVLVKVVNSYFEISDYDSLVQVCTNAIEGDYVVLTNNVVIDKTPVHEKETTDGVRKFAFVIDEFKGILDGQGYCIDLSFDSQDKSVIMCGLFNKIAVGAEVKNLAYNFTAHYIPTDVVSYTSAFVRSCQGVISSCYLEAHLYPSKASNAEGLIGYLENTNPAIPTAYIYNSIFDLETIVDGKIQNSGYAVRWGLRNPFGYNCALIRNGSDNAFYGWVPNGSVLEGNSCKKYMTLYDFVHGINGYLKSVYGVISKISDGQIMYGVWGDEWQVTSDEIRLCGRKVATVEFEEYNVEHGLNITDTRGLLSWGAEVGTVDIYIDGVRKITQNSNTFDVFNYIKSNYSPYFGEYKVVVDNGTNTGAVIYKIIKLTNQNFVSELRQCDTQEKAMFKYFIFGEDITIKSWKGSDYGDFTMAASQASGRYVFSSLYGNVDAMGHTLNVNIYTTLTSVGGFIGNNRCFWQNMVYKCNATYGNRAFGLLASNAWNGGFENCFMIFNAKAVDSNGNPIVDQKTTAIYTPRKAIYKNCIVMLNGAGKTTLNFTFDTNVYPTFENMLFVRNTEDSTMIVEDNLKRQFINCYHYKNVNDLLGCAKGVSINVANDTEYSCTEVEGIKAYASFDSVWGITEREVKLYGKTIIQIVETDDNIVNDEDIVG